MFPHSSFLEFNLCNIPFDIPLYGRRYRECRGGKFFTRGSRNPNILPPPPLPQNLGDKNCGVSGRTFSSIDSIGAKIISGTLGDDRQCGGRSTSTVASNNLNLLSAAVAT
jgi:hypothetical protein